MTEAIETSTTQISPSYAKLALALSKAQAVMGGAKMDSVNPHFRSKYADLASVWDACREPLSKNELAVAQFPESEGKKVTVKTMLLHSSGEYLETAISAEAKDASPQAIGSVITYLRRYSLAAMVGIAPEDDDGQAAQPDKPTQKALPSGGPTQVPPPSVLSPAEPQPITEKQLQQLGIECVRIFGQGPVGDTRARNLISEKVGRPIASRKELTQEEAAKLIKGLKATPDGKYATA